MDIEEIRTAAYEADKFLKRVKELEDHMAKTPRGYLWPGKETAALRRQSMELTRQLAKMRKPAR